MANQLVFNIQNKPLNFFNMNATLKDLQLLIIDAHGIYIAQLFCQQYKQYIVNSEELKDDIDICLKGPDDDDYLDSWVNVIDNAELKDDKGNKFTVGNLGDSGDLWAIPEGYEFPDDDF